MNFALLRRRKAPTGKPATAEADRLRGAVDEAGVRIQPVEPRGSLSTRLKVTAHRISLRKILACLKPRFFVKSIEGNSIGSGGSSLCTDFQPLRHLHS